MDKPEEGHRSETETVAASTGDSGLAVHSPFGWRRNPMILILGGLVLLAALLVMLFAGQGAEEDKDAAARAPVVSVLVPQRQTVTRVISATGTIGARRDIAVGVVGEGGQVARVLVEAGQWVQKGAPLAIIDRSVQSRQIEQLAAQIAVARADLNLAQAELDRAGALIERGFISEADVDRKQATRDAARARVRVAEASLAEARARTARLDILAPVGGIILERKVEPGQTVAQGSGTLFRMAEGGQMELAARLGEDDLAALAVGTAATVVPVGADTPFAGRIWQLSPVIDPQSRQGIARIALPYDKALRPGGFATATINAGSSTAPILPESAVQTDAKGHYVYIVGPDNRVARRNVTTGALTERGLTILSGLSGQEKVILFAAAFLNPGDAVRYRLRTSS